MLYDTAAYVWGEKKMVLDSQKKKKKEKSLFHFTLQFLKNEFVSHVKTLFSFIQSKIILFGTQLYEFWQMY